ncbi:MAG: triphosphoribosyl-dephospho-CoA synthase, partial [Phycisphaeraceae bacterium]|nr:triphosphoribosyl-dephospho-CoA synthase [Phycisphaeraceae bacterium]
MSRPSPDELAEAVRQACLLEAAAPKVGNVHPGAGFDDADFTDFAHSALVIAPIISEVADRGVGPTILEAVTATHQAIAHNTNLGLALLITPLAAAAEAGPLTPDTVREVIDSLTADDTA